MSLLWLAFGIGVFVGTAIGFGGMVLFIRHVNRI